MIKKRTMRYSIIVILLVISLAFFASSQEGSGSGDNLGVSIDVSVTSWHNDTNIMNNSDNTNDNSNANNNANTNANDDTKNNIALKLIHPPYKAVLKLPDILFQFSVDSKDVEECEFNLYRDEISIYNKFFDHPSGRQETVYRLGNGNYSWSVNCHNENSSAIAVVKRPFSINLPENLTIDSSYETNLVAEVNNAIDHVLNNPEEAYKILKEKMDGYKKRVAEIEPELFAATNSFDFNQSIRRTELIEELNNINRDVPRSVSFGEGKEYVISGVPDIDKLLSDYIKTKNLTLEGRENDFIAINKKKQNFNATVNVKQIYFEYADRNETFLQVSKRFDFRDIPDSVVEYIPAQEQNVVFLGDSSLIGNNLYELTNKSEYYVKDADLDFKPESFIVFNDLSNAITGFSVADTSEMIGGFIFIIFIIGFFVFLFFIIKKQFAPNNDMKNLLSMIGSSYGLLEKGNTKDAHKNYLKLVSKYDKLKKTKKSVYDKINNLKNDINRIDALKIVEKLKLLHSKGASLKEAGALYNKLSKIYPNLPDNYKRSIIYELHGLWNIKRT